MKAKPLRILIYVALAGIVLLLGLLLVPRRYDVLTFEERPNTLYWELETGSKIGYQQLAADSVNSPYPMIYLHGGPGGHINDGILSMLSPLQTHSEIYLYDQVGSGHSTRLQDIRAYNVHRHLRDLEAIIEQIGSDKVILMGQSWGAMLATQYLTEHPKKVEKMILTGPGPILPIKSELAQQESPDSLALKSPRYSNREGNQKANNLRSRFVRYCASAFGIKMATDREADRFFTYLSSELNKSTQCDPVQLKPASSGGGYYAHVMTVNSFLTVADKREQLKGLETPTLIIKGQCDNQAWGFTAEYLALLPNAELEIIEGAGHIIDKEHQATYIERILAFLRE